MRSLALRAGTVAGVVAVLALPATAVQAETTGAPGPTTAASTHVTTGRIVNGEALAAAVVIVPARGSTGEGPRVQRRPLGGGVAGSVGAEPAAGAT